LAYWLYYSAARLLPSTHLTILALLDPLVSAVIAIAFFDETLTLGAIVGGTLMLGAVAALRAPPDEEPPPPPPSCAVGSPPAGDVDDRCGGQHARRWQRRRSCALCNRGRRPWVAGSRR